MELKEVTSGKEDLGSGLGLLMNSTVPQTGKFWSKVGSFHYGMKDLDQAIQDYSKAIELNPKSSLYKKNLEIALRKKKKW